MNKVILMGRLVKNPEVRQDASGAISMARYTLAVDRVRTKKDDDPGADFINCVVFGKSAEFAKNYLRKGTKLVITGRIQTGSYTNKNCQKIYTTDVVIEHQEFAESKSESRGDGNQKTEIKSTDDGFMNGADGVPSEWLPIN